MAQADVSPVGFFDLSTTDFYCVHGGNECCQFDPWADNYQVHLDSVHHVKSSAIWADDLLPLDYSFKLTTNLMFDTSLTRGQGFAFVVQLDDRNALGEDTQFGFGTTIDPALPVVIFEAESTSKYSSSSSNLEPRFKVSMPLAEHNPTTVFAATKPSDGYEFIFDYNHISHSVQVFMDDNLLLEGIIDLADGMSGKNDAIWGFTLGGSVGTCVEDTIIPTRLVILEEEEEGDEGKGGEEEEEEEETDEAEEAENEANAIVLINETFDKEEGVTFPWSFVNNLFGMFGNHHQEQMLGLVGAQGVGRDGSKGMSVRLLPPPAGSSSSKSSIAAGFQYQFQLDHDVTNVELVLDYKTQVLHDEKEEVVGGDDDFGGQVMVALDGDQTSVFKCNNTGGNCSTNWKTTKISLGSLSAGFHTLQLGSVLIHTGSNESDDDNIQRRFDTRFDNLQFKMVMMKSTTKKLRGEK